MFLKSNILLNISRNKKLNWQHCSNKQTNEGFFPFYELRLSDTQMEKALDKVLEEILNVEGVTGCVASDKQGLCLGCRGIASSESSGLITAISEYAKNLHPNESAPTVVLENNEKQCIIQSNDKLVVSIHKNLVL